MTNTTDKATLSGFRKPRLAEDIKTEIAKDKTVRLNIDIDHTKLLKFKMYAVKNDSTMKQVLTDYIDKLISE